MPTIWIGVAAGLVSFLPAAPGSAKTLDMEGCIRHAREHSRELKKLTLEHRSQELNTLIQKAKFDPSLETSVNQATESDTTAGSLGLKKPFVGGVETSAKATFEDRKELTAEDGTITTSDKASLSVTLSKIILGGGSIRESRLDIDNSLIDEVIKLNAVNRLRRKLVLDIKRNYHQIIRGHQTLRIRELRLERAKKNLEHAVERENPLDIANAQLQVPDNESAVLQAKREIDSSVDSLKVLIGMDIHDDLAIDEAFEFREQAIDLTNDVKYCLQSHEDVLNARLEKKKLENTADVAGPRVWPKVTVSGTADQGSEEGVNLDGESDLKVGLTLSWPLGSRSDKAKKEQADNSVERQSIGIVEVEQGKTKEVRDLARKLEEAARTIRLQEERITISERRAALYADRWENGEIDILEYVRSQNDLENARIQLIQSRTAYMDTLAEYEFTVGR